MTKAVQRRAFCFCVATPTQHNAISQMNLAYLQIARPDAGLLHSPYPILNAGLST